MFNDFVEGAAEENARKGWAIVASTVVQALSLMAFLLIPVIYTQALPKILLNMKALLAPPAIPLIAIVRPPSSPREQRVSASHRFIDPSGIIREPRNFPKRPLIIEEPPIIPEDASNASDPIEGLSLLSYLTDKPAEAPRPVAPVAPPSSPQRIRQTDIAPAMILSQPQPAYPPLARMARIQGRVTLHAIIDREGRIAELHVISGHPLLVEAALMAVRIWRYRPTLLNAEPVEVETTINVDFVLGG